MKRIILIIFALITITRVYGNPEPNSNSRLSAKETMETSGEVGLFSEHFIKPRLEALDTEIEMRFSKEMIPYIENYLKTSFGKREFSSLLERCNQYMPIIEKALREAGLPDELKYIPVIESAMKAKSVSKQGAAGLWQFMPVAARCYNMKIGGKGDERLDPHIASERACRMFKDLYEKFGDWSLVLAAYNCGPGRLQQALRRAGVEKGKGDFWSVINYLPAHTRKYLPKFIAVAYVMNYYSEYGVKKVNAEPVVSADTVTDSESNPTIADKGEFKILPAHLEVEIAVAAPTVETRYRVQSTEYEDVPSKEFPNVFIRKRRTEHKRHSSN